MKREGANIPPDPPEPRVSEVPRILAKMRRKANRKTDQHSQKREPHVFAEFGLSKIHLFHNIDGQRA